MTSSVVKSAGIEKGAHLCQNIWGACLDSHRRDFFIADSTENANLRLYESKKFPHDDRGSPAAFFHTLGI